MKYIQTYEESIFKVGDYVLLCDYIAREKRINKIAKVLDIDMEDCEVQTLDGENEYITKQNIVRKLTKDEMIEVTANKYNL